MKSKLGKYLEIGNLFFGQILKLKVLVFNHFNSNHPKVSQNPESGRKPNRHFRHGKNPIQVITLPAPCGFQAIPTPAQTIGKGERAHHRPGTEVAVSDAK
ncbi:MAG: hypothetical protein WCH99_07040 [Verrucomicrobiota bacterium]